MHDLEDVRIADVEMYPTVAVHHFESTGDAYDFCQCDENIKSGDILVIIDEGVVGFADTWPVAITVEYGNLHTMAPGYKMISTIKNVTKERVTFAQTIAKGYGFDVR